MGNNRGFSLGDDFERVRRFLIDTYPLFDRLFNWGSDRWDVHRFTGRAQAELSGNRAWTESVRIWEHSGRIIGVVNPEGDNEAHLQIHPEHRGIEEEMLEWVAETWPTDRVLTWARQHDSYRRSLLRSGGWEEGGVDGFTHRRSLDGELPPGPIAEGYAVRSIDLRLRDDAERRAAISREVFGSKRTAELAAVLRQAPGYRPDLDLVAVAPDGTFAANTTVWLDEVNRYALFEPVGTHPEHRRRGLASAVIAEGLRRAVTLGATTAYVGSGTDLPANSLYASVGFDAGDAEIRYSYARRA